MSSEVLINEVVVISYFYMIVYNLSLILFFMVFLQILQGDVRAMGALGKFSIDPIKGMLLVIALCSMAGVPPLFGFFTKVLVLVLLTNSSFPIFFIFFSVLLLVGLYFYMQNIRFLYNDSLTYVEHPFGRESLMSPVVGLGAHLIALVLVFGIFFYDDIIQFLF